MFSVLPDHQGRQSSGPAQVGSHRCVPVIGPELRGPARPGIDDRTTTFQAGLADHLTVGRGARVAAQSGVIGDIEPGATVSGYPARDHRAVLRQTAALARIAPIVSSLERMIPRNEPS